MTNKMLAKGPGRVRAEAKAKAAQPWIQNTLKSGTWGKPRQTARYGNETEKQVIARLEELNPGTKFRIAE